jgi:PTH1 family peptidyl-tRNA hydrolase
VQLQQRILTTDDGRPAAVAGEYREGDETVRLLMPLTMMNESGMAVKAAQIAAADALIVCDDANLPLGTLRLRPEGGAGGHHGLQSCLEALATEQVARLRMGVGSTPLPQDLRDFVLSPFQSSERPLMKRAIAQAVDACEAWLKEGIEMAMNQYNRTPDIAS